MAVDEQEKAGRRKKGKKTVHNADDPDTEHWRPAFPTNITVDELHLFRKKRPDGPCLDGNLKIEEGSFKALKSEYTRRFKNPCEVLQSLDIRQHPLLTSLPTKSNVLLEREPEVQSEYNEKFSNRAMQGYAEPIHGKVDESRVENSFSNRLPSELLAIQKSSKFKRRLRKRATNLLLEGDFHHLTEYAEKFIDFLLSGRLKLCRRPTSIKLGLGSMDAKTETHDQFVDYEKVERPALCKNISQLHLEGVQESHTENQEKFQAFEMEKRPPLVKKLTNLHLEGDQSMLPEYAQQYVSYSSLERPKKYLPVNNLKPGGVFEDIKDEAMSRRDIHPLIPNLREPIVKNDDDVGDKTHKRSRRSSLRRGNDERSEPENVLSRAASHPHLGSSKWPTPGKSSDIANRKSRSSMVERNAYLDYEKAEKSSPTGKGRTGLSYMKGDGKLDGKPEYSTSFVDFPRERPSVKKPKSQLSPEGEVKYVSEQVDKYVPHGVMEKTESFRRVAELKVEGAFECQPEYRKAYIDYLIKEKKPPLAQRRRILELQENERNGTSPSETLSSSDATEKTKSTSPKKKTKTNLAASEVSTSVPGRRLSQIEDVAFGRREPTLANQKQSQGKTVKASVPKPKPEKDSGKKSRDISPAAGKGNWRARAANGTISSDNEARFPSHKEDPAFLIIDESSGRRKDSRKDQIVMSSWKTVQ